jgi:choline dehydrogenase-like flavoprotein
MPDIMIRNGQDISSGTELSTQVCIIGSGPAGITAAWQLQKAGIKVILIEGSREYSTREASWPNKNLLYGGKAVGQFEHNEPDFLILPKPDGSDFPWERERIYGGTSQHWGGQCRPQDPIDLEERKTGLSLDFPGWPITRADLDPYYAQASELMFLHGGYGLNGENFSNEYWANLLGDQVPALDGFDVEMYQFVGENYKKFAQRPFGGKPIGESAVDIILNASLLTIDHQQGSVSKLQVASMDATPKKATEFTIKADAYVLACGAVANARQLLLSKVGNDLVGRYFMCHPLSSGPIIDTFLPLDSAQANLMQGYKNGEFTQWLDKNGVWVQGRFIPNRDQTKNLGIGRCWFWFSTGAYYFEMAPNPKSRVTLLTDKDSPNWFDPVFNQNLTKIDWELSDVDENTYTKTTALFKTAVENFKPGGTVDYPTSWDDVKNQLVVNGHHMGTTRMSTDSTKGVVDPNLKVHSLNNLYVAGASVFPSAGISNPTFTIITLSIRLAEHLTKVL